MTQSPTFDCVSLTAYVSESLCPATDPVPYVATLDAVSNQDHHSLLLQLSAIGYPVGLSGKYTGIPNTCRPFSFHSFLSASSLYGNIDYLHILFLSFVRISHTPLHTIRSCPQQQHRHFDNEGHHIRYFNSSIFSYSLQCSLSFGTKRRRACCCWNQHPEEACSGSCQTRSSTTATGRVGNFG